MVSREDWRVGAALTGFVLVAFIIYNLIRSIAVPAYTAEREGYSKLYGFIEERLTGIEDIRTNGGKCLYHGPILRCQQRCLSTGAEIGNHGRNRTSDYKDYVRPRACDLNGYGHLSLSRWGVHHRYGLYGRPSIPPCSGNPLDQISRQLNDLQRATAGIKRIEALQRTTSQIQDGTETLPASGAISIEFDGVTFNLQRR